MDRILKWKFQTEGPIHSSPGLTNNIVYIGSDDFNLYALNTKDGTPLWSQKVDDRVHSSPAIHKGMVFFCSFDNYMYGMK